MASLDACKCHSSFSDRRKKSRAYCRRNAAYVNIAKGGDALWQIQFYQQPFSLKKNTIYTYGLWAKSEKPRNATMRIIHQGEPWNVYISQIISLTEEWEEFFITFKMPADDGNSRAGIIMGTDKNDVWVDHVRLYEGEYVQDIEGAEPHPVEPDGKLATTWAWIKRQQ